MKAAPPILPVDSVLAKPTITTMTIYRPSVSQSDPLDVAEVDTNTTCCCSDYGRGHWTQADLDSMNCENVSTSRTQVKLNSQDVRHVPCTFQFMEATSRWILMCQVGLSDGTEISDGGRLVFYVTYAILSVLLSFHLSSHFSHFVGMDFPVLLPLRDLLYHSGTFPVLP